MLEEVPPSMLAWYSWILEQVGYWKHHIQISALFLVLIETTERFQRKNEAKTKLLPTIPDKKVGARIKFSPPPTFNVDNPVIFSLFVRKNAIFSNIDWGGRGIRDTAQVSQLLLAGIVD